MTFLLSVLLMGAVSCSGSDYNSETTDNENSTTDERIDLNGKKILIAYWSWSGNTEAVAQEIQRQAGGDLYPMQPLVPYGTTYQEVAYGGRTKDEADNHPRDVDFWWEEVYQSVLIIHKYQTQVHEKNNISLVLHAALFQ